ncbi:hypothetical protein BZA77DRAFT_92045 [Pyronema omphalodes]|nr:hypothetical protein BZA77DRAFT_92045 [Pyronema omphalodes]
MVLVVEYSSNNLPIRTWIPPSTTRRDAQITPVLDDQKAQVFPLGAALSLYPFLTGLVRHLDLTDLQNLASTCRQVHSILISQHAAIKPLSQRCGYPAKLQKSIKKKEQERERPGTSTEGTETGGIEGTTNEAAAGGVGAWREIRNSSRCARDLIRPCLRCSVPICRNCISNPRQVYRRTRIRRLCTPCQTDPSALPPSSATRFEINKSVCNCTIDAWFCQQCTQELLAEDHAYRAHCEQQGEVGEEMSTTLRMVRDEQGNMRLAGRNENSWGPVSCARGSDCVGLKTSYISPWDDFLEEHHETEVGDDWDALAEAIEQAGEQRIEDEARISQGLKKVRRAGAPVVIDKGWVLTEEWNQEVRAFCNWCDRVILSKEEESVFSGNL